MGKSVVAEIRSLIPQDMSNLPWYERHAAQHGELLAQILVAWNAGDFGTRRRAAARAVSEYLRQRGVVIGEQGVDEWLRRNTRPAK